VDRTLRVVAASFAVFGLLSGAFAVSAIDIRTTFDLSDTQLGVLLGAGIFAATWVAVTGGVLTDRWGARVALQRALLTWGALLAVEALAPALGVFAPAFVLATAAGGMVDVVMNIVAADQLASEPGRLVRFHGWFNGAAVAGAIVTGLVVRFGASWRVMWAAIAVLAIVTAAATRRATFVEAERVHHPSMLRALFQLRHDGLVLLAIVFGTAAMVEGGIATWGVLYLRGNLGVGVLAGVAAYVVGATLATIARVAGGPLIGALGSRRSIAIGGSLAAGGIAAEALSHNVVIASIGLAAGAVGISVVWPLLIADVSNQAPRPALAIGGVTAAGYLGMVAGPPIVGFVAGAFGLRAGLLLLAAAALFVALTPARVRAAAATV
jgi:MFS family permease